ncbi:hypothetical protein ASPSYDRAFT_74209 [Aspergillus sydowii CBS 593.65]|uniref:MICOS complex subunit MIC12 n=1 Tax=Aspergillus sydowii CBS 593.65 TaxID=1036612 RepID=A0A1L9TV63_9EURO|nr:uncharacterized protein ASPSYDRAFT_74209 [Aspergillus sydowii CBS 593.65]OJJ63312.1 hypothetical protein ASPSYDRAFT_74209 [Aspergillus sydowii CBS 593.65]
MGFFTGFFSGFALTTSVLYITIRVHHSTRLEQKSAIRDQTKMIDWLASSRGAYDRRLLPKDDEDIASRERALAASKPPMKDQLKHQWNEEVRMLARKAYESGWEDVRDAAAEGWRGVRSFVKRE